ncbi:MAG TPA: gp7 family phage scaffolding protein [Candidatus Saccharimonadales bacterium]|nr:gp7 family phage scaffolding protein [Candidatus Saccharimonadales bacterium]
MPLSHEDHENLLNELNNPELDVVRRTEVLQLMRTNFGETSSVLEDSQTLIQKNQQMINDLTLANSKLFRQIGIEQDQNQKQKEDAKTRSETITLESLNA